VSRPLAFVPHPPNWWPYATHNRRLVIIAAYFALKSASVHYKARAGKSRRNSFSPGQCPLVARGTRCRETFAAITPLV